MAMDSHRTCEGRAVIVRQSFMATASEHAKLDIDTLLSDVHIVSAQLSSLILRRDGNIAFQFRILGNVQALLL